MHVVRVHGFWFQKDSLDQSRIFIRMELCAGTLEDYKRNLVNEAATIEPLELTEIMLQILTGLYYCHVQGYCHRDLKPSNGLSNI